jgi:uncharacterized protein (DUF58 family)
MTDDEAPLLSREDVRQLERLSLASLQAIGAGIVGHREGPGRGSGAEFVDYRRYAAGDDLRRIDWHVYARLRELLVRTAPREARVWLSLLLDTSASMDDGEPNKLHYGRRLAALLGAVALLRADAVRLHVLSDGDAVAGAKLDAIGMLSVLETEARRLPAGRTTRLASSIRRAREADEPPEIAVLISDGLVPPDDLAEALAELGRAGRSTAMLHVLDPAERAAGEAGNVQLRDRETGQEMQLAITEQVQERYAERYERLRSQTEDLCRRNGIAYTAAPTTTEPLELLLASARIGVVVAANQMRE